MVVTAESVQERGLSAGMSETAAAHVEAVEVVRRKRRARPANGAEFYGVRRERSGKYGAQIWDRSRQANLWLGTFGTAEEAARAFDAAAVQLRGVARTNFKIPAAVHSRASVTARKAESGQGGGQGMSAGNCEIAEEHGDGVDAQTTFENVRKYYNRTMDHRAGRNDGMGMICPVIGRQPEALHGLAGAASLVVPPATAVGVPGMVGPLAVRPLAELPPVGGATAGTATPVVGGNLSFSTSNTEGYSDEEDSDDEGTDDMDERGKGASEGGAAAGAGTGNMMRFFEGRAKQVMEQQEAMQQRFLEAIEKREQDRMIREEAWRRQMMAREQEIVAQERAMAAIRGAGLLSLIQKITGQTIPMPSIAAPAITFMPPPSSQSHAPPPTSSQPPTCTQPQRPSPRPPTMAPATPQPQQQQPLVVHQSSTDIVMTPAEKPRNGPGGGSGAASSSSPRWSNAEVHALIQLRSNLLDMRCQEGRTKGPLWGEISAGMCRMGFSRSSMRCKQKWENMNRYFRKVKGIKKRSEDSKWCSYFHYLEALYRNKAALLCAVANAAPQPHTLPPVAKNGAISNDGNGHVLDLLNDLREADDFLEDMGFTGVVA